MPPPRGRSAMPGGAARNSKQQEALERHQEVLHGFSNVLDYIASDLGIQPGDNTYVSGADEFSARSDAAPPPDPEKTIRNPDGIHDVITIAEDPYFLGLTLTPWQRIILKLFYGGSSGNQHLVLDDTRLETGCGDGKVGCVWAKNRRSEENFVRRLRTLRERNQQGFIPLPLMNAENSPCIGCTRFDPEMRQESLDYRIENAKDDDAADMAKRATVAELTDRYETERDLFNHDLPSDAPFDVRKQVAQKTIDRRSTFDELVMVLGRRSGKALALDTPIITPTGWKTMGDLKVGDSVFGEDGFPTRIVALSEIMDDRPCYEVEFSNGETIIADEQHSWVTVDARERKNAARSNRPLVPAVHTTEEIARTLHVPRKDSMVQHNHAVLLTKPLQWPEVDLPIDPYLFGVWLGDGCRTNGIITTADAEIIAQIEAIGYRVTKDRTSPYGWRVREGVAGIPFLTQLKSLGVNGCKEIPEAYLRASEAQRLALFQGLMDTDGWVGKSGHCEFTNTNRKLAEQFLELAVGLGIKATFNEGITTLKGRAIGPKYRIHFTPRAGLPVCRLARKAERLPKATRPEVGRVYITRVTRLERSVPVRCIQVDNASHCYLAGRSMVPTHNSFMTAVICCYEVYRLLKMGHPQLRYPILPYGEMTILNVAKSEAQAKNALFNQIKALVFTSPYFAAQIGKDKELEIFFLTPADREENARREKNGQTALLGTVKLQSGHSNAGTLVGLACPIVVLDEVAEYGDARELYEKLAPMVSTFGDGKIICISNPTGPTGLFFDLYREGLKNKRSLVFQLPSWCSNPNIPRSELESLKYKLGTNYDIYIGAMFGDGGENPFLPRQYVDAAFQERSHRTRSEYGQAHINYFVHLDPSKNSDYYTLAVVHTEPTGEIDEQRRPVQKVVVDHIHVWKPDGKFAIDPRLVDDYIIKLSQRFRIAQLSYDQWNSVESIMRLTAAGLPHRLKTFNKQYNDEIYEQAYTLFITERISFYGCDSTQNIVKGLPGRQVQVQENIEDASLCKRQWTLLQRVWKGDHYKIEAMDGENDDIPDAVAAAAYEALKTKVVGALPRPRTMYTGWRR